MIVGVAIVVVVAAYGVGYVVVAIVATVIVFGAADVVYYVDVVMYGVTVCCVHAVVRVCVGRC